MILAVSLRRLSAIALVALGAASAFAWRDAAAAAAPAACTAQDFATAIDKSGSALRALTLKEQPRLQERIRGYAAAKGIDVSGGEDAALDAIQDDRLKALNEQSASLLLQIDTLGRIDEGGAVDCSKLAEIERLSGTLMQVMREKSAYMVARLDAAIAATGGGKTTATAPAATAKPVEKKAAANKKPETEKKAVAQTKPETRPKIPATAMPSASAGRESAAAKTAEAKPATKVPPNDAYSPAAQGRALEGGSPGAPAPGIGSAGSDAFISENAEGYSIEEIRGATRGFFGAISTNLAAVIEHAFKTSGRPTAYVLGTEGGGAFFAGLRFGQGTLFMRHQSFSRPVYWHGPSLGTDFGAAGSRTLFLIYKMHQPDQLFRTFTGVDGSAYLVGGVGLTLLKGGDVIMAPIRSGLGLRVGANIGYLRFSDHATWNPF